jgi:hypothetical protein
LNIAAVYSGLAADLATVLRATDHIPPTVEVPAAFLDAAVIEFDDTFEGDYTATIPVVLLASTADVRSGKAKLDELTPLVRAAISHTLGGAAQSTRCLRVERYGDLFEVGGLAYIGGVLIVEVYAA